MLNVKLNVDYKVKSISELGTELNTAQAGLEAVNNLQSNVYQDLVGRTCWEIAHDDEGLTEDNFTDYCKEFETGMKDVMQMVYAVDENGIKHYRQAGKILNVAVKDTQRKLEVNGKTYQIKHEKMPNSYRSAKTVIGKAVKHNVEILDHEGNPKAKGVVEAEIKEATSVTKTEFEKYQAAITLATQLADKLESEQVAAAKVLAATLWGKLENMEAELNDAA